MSARATAFLIWREGTAVGWDCTYRQLASATGLSYVHIRKTCRARGWHPRRERYETDNQDYSTAERGRWLDRVLPVDTVMERGIARFA